MLRVRLSSIDQMKQEDETTPSSFLVLVSGQIDSAQFHGIPDVYCKYHFVYGSDWTLVTGFEDGMSQLCCRSTFDPSSDQFVLNFPLDVTLRSTSPRGWPRLVICCYGSDWWGNDVIRGYGFTHVPTTVGSHHRKVMMFVPKSSSYLKQLLGSFFGKKPEYANPTFIAQSESRDVTHVEMVGSVTVTMQVLTKGMKKLGYDCCRQTLKIVSEYPWKMAEEAPSSWAPASAGDQPKAMPRHSRRLDTVVEKDETQGGADQESAEHLAADGVQSSGGAAVAEETALPSAATT